jgi:hypothetical protein
LARPGSAYFIARLSSSVEDSAATNLNDPTTMSETRSPMPNVSTLTLNNGVELPALGLGVFQTPHDETRAAVEAALSAGYRHIDTAAAYGNERQVGEAVQNSGLNRSEVFLETKIWISDYGYDKTLHGFDKSARKLGVDQIDLLILHQALPSDFEATLEAYRALRRCLPMGRYEPSGSATSWSSTHHAARPHYRGAGSQPDRGSPLLPARTQAWSPIGGITFYRDGQHSSPAGPGHRRHRQGPR